MAVASAGDAERAQQDRAVERVDQAPVVFERPGPLDPAVDAARQQAVGADDGERREEENGKPQAGGEQEPEAEAGHEIGPGVEYMT